MELFHTLNRGVDKRKIFMNEKDYFRFVRNLYVFNDQDQVFANDYYFKQSFDLRSQKKKSKGGS